MFLDSWFSKWGAYTLGVYMMIHGALRKKSNGTPIAAFEMSSF